MAKKVFGIDFGTSVIKIFGKGQGIIVDEKNIIAMKKKKIYAGGNEAYDMFEKAPEDITVSYPMKNGVIAEFENMQQLLSHMLKKHCMKKSSFTTAFDFYIAVPTHITGVERKAFDNLVRSCIGKAKEVILIDKPITAAVGIGVDVRSASGVMTVDIGSDTTEIGIISLGGIVLSKLIPVGGNKLDECIQMVVKKKYNLYIGRKTAELIKLELASALPTDDRTMKVYGRDVVTGLPRETEVGADLVHESIKEQLHSIVDAIKMILERTPPEIASDIIDSGIYLTGGSAKIRDLDKLISKETDLLVNISEDCENSVVNGLGMIMDDDSLLASIYHER